MRTIIDMIVGVLFMAFAMLAVFGVIRAVDAYGRDGQEYANPEDVKHWFRTLMQPDQPGISCCGEADAYWADTWKLSADGKNYIAVITDERDDAPLGRPHVAPGTEVLVPNHKMKYDQGNPTGHGVIFMNSVNSFDGSPPNVLCYVVPGGV